MASAHHNNDKIIMDTSGIQQESWRRLSPWLRQCLAVLAIDNSSSLSNGMRTYIEARHLAEVLEIVDNATE